MSKSFDELIAVMARLRAPGGCPWDAEQTYQSLSQYLLEEAYETFDAIHAAGETGDTTHLTEELGDVLLQVVFHSTIAAERGDFTIDDVAAGVAKKLVLRHPHVFGDKKLDSAAAVLDNWDELKANERAVSGKPEKVNNSLLDEVPVHFPALLESLKVSKKAAKVGFDWPDVGGALPKIADRPIRPQIRFPRGSRSPSSRAMISMIMAAMVNRVAVSVNGGTVATPILMRKKLPPQTVPSTSSRM